MWQWRRECCSCSPRANVIDLVDLVAEDTAASGGASSSARAFSVFDKLPSAGASPAAAVESKRPTSAVMRSEVSAESKSDVGDGTGTPRVCAPSHVCSVM
jgi:hypothetical protein